MIVYSDIKYQQNGKKVVGMMLTPLLGKSSQCSSYLTGNYTSIGVVVNGPNSTARRLCNGSRSARKRAVISVVSVLALQILAIRAKKRRWFAVPIAVAVVFAGMGAYLIFVHPPISITIKDPSDNSSVGFVASVLGTWQNIPKDRQRWLMLYSINASRYYPQGSPIKLVKIYSNNPRGVWAGAVLCGQPTTGIGERFIILSVVTTQLRGICSTTIRTRQSGITPA